jgi:preprotein translocase subunit SecE
MKLTNYISEAFTELKENVTWPEWAEVQRLTIIVAVFSVIFAYNLVLIKVSKLSLSCMLS